MENPDDQRAAGKVDSALRDAHQYNYFQLIELLYQVHGDDLEQRPADRETRRRVRLEVSPKLSFPVADVLRADRLGDDRYRIEASFLGLHGTDSPLPTYFLDDIAYENAHGIGLRPAYNIDQDPVWNSEATPKPFENLGWYQCNHLGTPTEISDSSSEIIWQATFTTAGNETANSKNAIRFADNQQPTSQIRFQGQYFDTETNLHYNRYRYYDPQIGRFIGKDPIGLSGGINIYNYGPNPVEWVDPLGLWSENPKFKYRQNENGTLRSVVAQIRDSDLDTGTDTNRSARRYIKSIGCGGDHAGHAIANRLGGLGRKGNVFPQNGNVNTGQFRIFEENIYHQAKNPENKVIVRITPQYERGETRPHSILYQARVNGVTQRQEFPNPCGCPCL